MSRSDDERIADILEASEKLLEIVGCGHEFFLTESLAQLASERLIEIIGDRGIVYASGDQRFNVY